MDERLVEKLSDTEAIVEGLGPTQHYFAHVFRPFARTVDSWNHCCEAASADLLRACPRYGTGVPK